MNFRISALAFLLLLVVVAPVQAAEHVKLSDVVKTVEQAFRPDSTLRDVKADFFQRTTLAEKGKEIRADGEMLLKAATSYSPLKFRFEYFRPTRHEIVSDGRWQWIYLPENRQVLQTDVSIVFGTRGSGRESFGAANFLQRLDRISEDFLITYSPQMYDMQGNYVLELAPRRSSTTISKLFIVVNRYSVARPARMPLDVKNPQDWGFPILSTTVVDPKGNTTTMEFSNIRTNTGIFDAMFNFTIPAGVQVVNPADPR